MTHDPHGPVDPGPAHGSGPGEARARPGSTGARAGARTPDALRLLLGLTVLSFGLSVLDRLVETFAGPPGLPALEGIVNIAGVPGGELAVVVMLFAQALTAVLYTLVYFGLHYRHQWGWALGVVFCSLAVIGDVFNLAVYVLGGHLVPALGTCGLVVVNVAWLVVAAHPGVRAVLR